MYNCLDAGDVEKKTEEERNGRKPEINIGLWESNKYVVYAYPSYVYLNALCARTSRYDIVINLVFP